jgi:hypothetical protein
MIRHSTPRQWTGYLCKIVICNAALHVMSPRITLVRGAGPIDNSLNTTLVLDIMTPPPKNFLNFANNMLVARKWENMLRHRTKETVLN